MSDIVIVCNTRAEAGPLASVIAALPEASVVGMNRDEQCGVPPWVMARGLEYFADVLRGAKLVVLLGDRYETLAAALAATFLRIPIAHIHGGETTTGAFDDAFRDSITRMSALHFVATDQARHRVFSLQHVATPNDLGASYSNIHIVGAPGLDGVMPQSARRDRKLILVTYHPETLAADYGAIGCRAMLEALPLGYEIVYCGVNNDPGSNEIRALIGNWLKTHGGVIRPDITHTEYMELMQHAALGIGNSSSLVIECPWVGCPSVLIGDRQMGRPASPSVFHYGGGDLKSAVKMALAFRGPYRPCYTGGAAPKIATIVREYVRDR